LKMVGLFVQIRRRENCFRVRRFYHFSNNRCYADWRCKSCTRVSESNGNIVASYGWFPSPASIARYSKGVALSCCLYRDTGRIVKGAENSLPRFLQQPADPSCTGCHPILTSRSESERDPSACAIASVAWREFIRE
jgi:hypothetical protein